MMATVIMSWPYSQGIGHYSVLLYNYPLPQSSQRNHIKPIVTLYQHHNNLNLTASPTVGLSIKYHPTTQA